MVSTVACTAIAQTSDRVREARRIGVAVWAGSELKLQQTGFMAFGNQSGRVDAPGDDLAGAVYDAVAHELGFEQRYTVSRLPIAATDLPRLRRAHDASGDFWGRTLIGLGPEIDALRARCDCDRLLLVAETTSEVPGTNQYVRGLTMYRGADPDKAAVIAPLALYAIDPASGQEVGSSRALVQRAPIAVNWAGKAEDVRQLEPEQWAAVQQGIRRVLPFTLPEALHKVGLRPSCAQHFYEWYTPAPQREPSHSGYIPAPVPVEGADPARCTAPGTARSC